MAISRKIPRKAAAKTTRKTARRASTAVSYKVRALPGKASAGKAVNPSARTAMRATLAEVRKSRPYSSRYPIPDAEFVALKAGALSAKLGKVTATLAADTGSKDVEPSPRAMGSPALMPGMAPAMAPSASANFDGIAATRWLPPDCTLATGPDHVLVSVNSSVAIHAKTGGAALLSRTLTAWFANVAQGMTIFDPKALYDQHAGRWVLLAVAFTENPNRSVFLLSCSNSPDPMASWRNYSLNAMVDGSTPTNNWADYPGLGVDNQAIYLTANMFAFGGDFKYAKVRVVPKAGPYSGGAAAFFDFVRLKDADGQLSFTVTPCHTFGAPQVEYMVNSKFPSGNKLTLWNITNPTGTPTLTRTTVNVSSYSLPPNANQKGGGTALNTGDIRVLHAVFRGDSIWTALTTAHNWGAGTNRASIHWFQIRGATSTLVQEGIYGSSSKHYYYPAPCPDNNGNMIMVCSRSGTTEHAQVRYTGRLSSDTPGKLQTSRLLKAGTANYKALDGGSRNRWGDYAGVASDPANNRVVWFYSMYAVPANQWATRVGSALF
jgi:hypothetical protein